MSMQPDRDERSRGLAEKLAAASAVCSQYDCERMNEAELMEYYSLHGALRGLRLKARLARNYVLHRLAINPPHPNLTVVFHRMRGVNIGEHVYIGPYVQIDLVYPHLITIEDYASIGMNCMIFAHSNPTYSLWLKVKKYPRSVAPVRIKKGAWIPPGVIILPGVTIGEHSVVGAGSVVNKDVEPFTMVAGCPARLIRRLDDCDT